VVVADRKACRTSSPPASRKPCCAFEGIGGDATFQKWARKNQTEFYKIAARLIPSEVVGDPERPVGMKVTFGGRYRPDEQP
jgi:hypothetical protein